MNTLHQHVLAFAAGALLLMPAATTRANDLEDFWEDRQEALEEYQEALEERWEDQREALKEREDSAVPVQFVRHRPRASWYYGPRHRGYYGQFYGRPTYRYHYGYYPPPRAYYGYRYYGTPRVGYYDYRRGGAVSVGPVRVYW